MNVSGKIKLVNAKRATRHLPSAPVAAIKHFDNYDLEEQDILFFKLNVGVKNPLSSKHLYDTSVILKNQVYRIEDHDMTYFQDGVNDFEEGVHYISEKVYQHYTSDANGKLKIKFKSIPNNRTFSEIVLIVTKTQGNIVCGIFCIHNRNEEYRTNNRKEFKMYYTLLSKKIDPHVIQTMWNI